MQIDLSDISLEKEKKIKDRSSFIVVINCILVIYVILGFNLFHIFKI